MLKSITWAAIAALAVSAALADGGPASTRPYSHTTTVNGVRLTIAVQRPAYPRNVVVQVTATLRNASGALVYYPVGCNGTQNPYFAVVNAAGRRVDPPHVLVPAPRGPIVESCLAPLPRPVPPGHSLRWSTFLVLRGDTVSVRLGLAGTDHSIFPASFIIARLHVRLSRPDPPQVALATNPSVVAVLSPRGRVQGRPRIADWWLCPGDNPANGAASRSFVPISAAAVSAPCAHPVQWHAVAGWVGHSIVAIDYPHA